MKYKNVRIVTKITIAPSSLIGIFDNSQIITMADNEGTR